MVETTGSFPEGLMVGKTARAAESAVKRQTARPQMLAFSHAEPTAFGQGKRMAFKHVFGKAERS